MRVTTSRLKALVKSNYVGCSVTFDYKNYRDSKDPVRLPTVTVSEPNDSGMVSLLTISTTMMRINFWQEPDQISGLLRNAV